MADVRSHHSPRVLVLGSINEDVIARVGHLPHPGETVVATANRVVLGGKGANQAVAVARTGVSVAMVGAVGADAEGQRMRERLADAGVNTDAITTVGDAETGRAFVWVNDQGENVIVVVSGANDRMTAAEVSAAAGAIANADVVVLQGELPAEATLTAFTEAEKAGTRVIMNLAPFSDLGPAVRSADPLVVNEVETAQLLGRDIPTMNDEVARQVAAKAASAVITLGAQGALVAWGADVRHVPAPQARGVIDTTGAGDAFVGVLAAALASGCDLLDATKLAVHAATASISVEGAGDQYPEFSLSLPLTSTP